MDSRELREKFLEFFVKRGHKTVPSSSLLPSDTSVLFTTAGMQQFVLDLEGKADPVQRFGSRHLASCQKCFRSDDIEEVGDDTHHTFFEMLGNWSIGQDEGGHYFKEGAIELASELLSSKFKVSPPGSKQQSSKLWITVFEGNKEIPEDIESQKIWQGLGIPKERIKKFGTKDNLWGPVAETGVCGPNSEIHYDRGKEFGCGKKDCGPNCPRCQRFVEIWNLVFIQYHKKIKDQRSKIKTTNQKLKIGEIQKPEYEYVPLPLKSVDTGMGLERMTAILQDKPSAYETDLFRPIIEELEKISSVPYALNVKPFRIIADHIRGSVFLISEGILPSNIGQGYILRRLLRRTMRCGKILGLPAGRQGLPAGRQGIKPEFLIPLAKRTIEVYKDIYPEMQSRQASILTVIQKEEEKFKKALEKGTREGLAIVKRGDISGKQAFDLYQSYGFPLEMVEEMAKESNREVDKQGFQKELKKHQQISRAGRERKFGGGGAFSPELHTATHLLHSALRQVLGEEVKQMGSDITAEKLRFDFSFGRKILPEELKKIEDLVNLKIKEDLAVKKEEMLYEEALKSGALAFFKEKYPERVSVYSIDPSTHCSHTAGSGQVFSREICAGPHAQRTGSLGKFRIVKEESSSAGVRRIRAVLEKG